MYRTSVTALQRIMIALALLTAIPAANAAEPVKKDATSAADPTRGPVWKSWHARLDEDKADDYIRYVTKVYHLQLEAWKKAGLITDYKVLINEAHSATDSDITFMYQYANMAALDTPDAAWEKVTAAALEKLKDDEEAQQLIKAYASWRTFVGRSPIAREVVAGK